MEGASDLCRPLSAGVMPTQDLNPKPYTRLDITSDVTQDAADSKWISAGSVTCTRDGHRRPPHPDQVLDHSKHFSTYETSSAFVVCNLARNC